MVKSRDIFLGFLFVAPTIDKYREYAIMELVYAGRNFEGGTYEYRRSQ